MEQFEGRTAVVTGAASGIGYALAEAFGRQGMHLVLADIEHDALVRAEERLAATPGRGELLAVPTDVADPGQVSRLAQEVGRVLGPVHLLCNNAGVAVGGAPLWELEGHDWEWCLDVNLWGVIHGIRAFVPAMVAHGEAGHVVNTASLAGHLATPMLGPYNTSKYAVVGLSETLRAELAMLASSIGVSVLCPGFVRTRIAESARNRPDHLPEPDRTTTEGAALLEGATPPEDIAQVVLDAVREDRFWIVPHAYALPAIEARFEAIRDSAGPFDTPTS